MLWREKSGVEGGKFGQLAKNTEQVVRKPMTARQENDGGDGGNIAGKLCPLSSSASIESDRGRNLTKCLTVV